jgi:hypothetical protein
LQLLGVLSLKSPPFVISLGGEIEMGVLDLCGFGTETAAFLELVTLICWDLP